MERKDYLTTGELTQLMGITKHTLFHYDDIGLFQPKYINEKGYRFYSSRYFWNMKHRLQSRLRNYNP